MLISDKKKFVQSPFDSDDELKKMVVENAEYFFGQSSFCLSKELVSAINGFEEVPDGFAIDIANRQWFIVNVSLAKHSVWSHVAPQVVKQLVASDRSLTKQLLIELIIQQVRKDKDLMEKFSAAGIYKKKDTGVFDKDIRGVLGEIFGKSPILGITVDSISKDLRDLAATLRVNVRSWVVKKYVELGNTENTLYEIPEDCRPELDTAEESDYFESKIAQNNEESEEEVSEVMTVKEINYR